MSNNLLKGRDGDQVAKLSITLNFQSNLNVIERKITIIKMLFICY